MEQISFTFWPPKAPQHGYHDLCQWVSCVRYSNTSLINVLELNVTETASVGADCRNFPGSLPSVTVQQAASPVTMDCLGGRFCSVRDDLITLGS